MKYYPLSLFFQITVALKDMLFELVVLIHAIIFVIHRFKNDERLFSLFFLYIFSQVTLTWHSLCGYFILNENIGMI